MPYSARTYQISQSLLYHLFNRGNGRSEIYHETEDYYRFIDILRTYSEQRKLKIYHWVLMPNHYHLLLELEAPKEISKVMAGVGRSYVHYHNRKYNSSGHLFQDRFKSQAVEKNLYLLSCARYIERNPVEAHLTSSSEEYPYSSAAYYCLGEDDGLTKECPLFTTFGETPETRRQNYREFLKEFKPEEDKLFMNMEKPRGSKEFIRRLIKEGSVFAPRNGRPKVEKVVA